MYIYYLHSFITFIFVHSSFVNPRGSSTSMVSWMGKPSLGCRAENRTLACLTVSRRTTNWAAPLSPSPCYPPPAGGAFSLEPANQEKSRVRICEPFKTPRDRFPAWRNRFLGIDANILYLVTKFCKNKYDIFVPVRFFITIHNFSFFCRFSALSYLFATSLFLSSFFFPFCLLIRFPPEAVC